MVTRTSLTFSRQDANWDSDSGQRTYRLIDRHGAPHPCLDAEFESLDSAWSAALGWWQRHHEQNPESVEAVGIGVEVSTPCGSWRTLRYPGSYLE